MSAASASGSGNVTHLTFVADLDSPSSDLVSVSVTSPDGASAMAMMSAPCSLGEQARWTGELDLATPATLAGRWQLLLQDQGLGSTGPGTQVAHAWLYAH
jgi:hypothetical protein